MKTKIETEYTYMGFGFPVELNNVTMIYIEKSWHPKINVEQLSHKIIKKIALQAERLTGAQVKFIRYYFSMSLRQFAKHVVHESHMAVSKWEAALLNKTKMDANIEMMLRLYIIEKTLTRTEKQKSQFFDRYIQLRTIWSA